MGSIKTLDALDNGEIALTPGNFPSCMAMFVAEDLEVGVSTEWVDRIHGITVPITSLAAATNSDANARNFTIATDTELSSGVWQSLTGKDFIMFAVAQIIQASSDSGITIGTSASNVRARNMVTSGTTVRVVSDGTNTDTAAAGSANTKNEVIGNSMTVDVDGNVVVKEITAAGVLSDIQTFATTNLTDFGAAPDSKIQFLSMENIYTLMFFRFDALPGDIDATFQWLKTNVEAGNVALPPNWQGRS